MKRKEQTSAAEFPGGSSFHPPHLLEISNLIFRIPTTTILLASCLTMCIEIFSDCCRVEVVVVVVGVVVVVVVGVMKVVVMVVVGVVIVVVVRMVIVVVMVVGMLVVE